MSFFLSVSVLHFVSLDLFPINWFSYQLIQFVLLFVVFLIFTTVVFTTEFRLALFLISPSVSSFLPSTPPPFFYFSFGFLF